MARLLWIFLVANFKLSCQYSLQESDKYHPENSAFIKFNPFVSSLDKSNQYRYTISDMVTLLALVATRFSRVFIEMSISDLEYNRNTSLALAPLAVARYNLKARQPIEVWLAYEAHAETTFHSFLGANDLPSRLQDIADNANAIFNDTVTTIFIPYNHFHLHRNRIKKLQANSSMAPDRRYVFGVTLQLSSCFQFTSKLLRRKPQLLLISLPPIIKTLSPEELSYFISESYKGCKEFINSAKPTSVGYITSVPDTYDYNRVNMSRFVDTWGQLRQLLEFTDNPLVLSQAFDTPYQPEVQQKTNGWWQIKNMHDCNSVSCYAFQEKRTHAKEFDMKENSVDYKWLDAAPLISKDYTGVIFSLYTKGTPYIESKLTFILRDISKRYSKVMMLVDDDTLDRSPSIVQEARALTTLHGTIEIMLLLMNHVDIRRHQQFQSIDVIAERFGVPGDLYSTYLLMYSGNQTLSLKTFLQTNALSSEKRDKTSYKLGITFPASFCSGYQAMNQMDQNLISQIIQDEDWNALYFHFEEDKETVKLGANRTFEQRIVVLEECKRFAVSMRKAQNQTVELGFIALHYEVNTEFYKDPWRIMNFAKYWEMLTKWAGETQTVVILNSAIDSPRTFKREVQRKEKQVLELEMGWWRYEPTNTKLWISKKNDALNKFKDHTSGGGLGVGEIVAISLVPFILVVIIFSIFLYRHYKRSDLQQMSKDEIDEFFDGLDKNYENNENGNVYKLPYDKTRYEIASKDFTLENEASLGAGEFGKVVQGKIETPEGKINVAVKMVNLEKAHKTALTGLLSEIKVLGYIGKHDNIVELLGANTEQLKQGKVYVFLELCQLGSLEKHLRNIRPQTSDLSETIPVLDFGNRYVNFTKVENNQGPILDESLANDLYRWSMEICNGMSYLAMKNVVHADLATRNVLLNLKRTAKICDFGLSRRMYNYTNYVKQKQEPLPWKWMAPEALKFMEFNEKTDVWAFGVTLWEMYSLGVQPYPGLSWDINFPKLLEQGLRMGEPKYNERNVHKLMMQCWRNDPTQRPSFADLLLHFNSEE